MALCSGSRNASGTTRNQCPTSNQSVARQVGLVLSYILTPSSISLTMTRFDSSKIDCSLVFQVNGVPGLRRRRKGSILWAMLKAYETWLTRPNHERMSVMFLRVGKSRMAWRYFQQGWTLSRVMSNPANSTLSAANTNLETLKVMPFFPQTSRYSTACQKLSSMESDHSRASSTHFVLLGMWATMSS